MEDRKAIRALIEEKRKRVASLEADHFRVIYELEQEIEQLILKGMQAEGGRKRYEEKEEVHEIKQGRKRIPTKMMIGRVHWVETFKDEDTGKGIDVERSRVVKQDGKWVYISEKLI